MSPCFSIPAVGLGTLQNTAVLRDRLEVFSGIQIWSASHKSITEIIRQKIFDKHSSVCKHLTFCFTFHSITSLACQSCSPFMAVFSDYSVWMQHNLKGYKIKGWEETEIALVKTNLSLYNTHFTITTYNQMQHGSKTKRGLILRVCCLLPFSHMLDPVQDYLTQGIHNRYLTNSTMGESSLFHAVPYYHFSQAMYHFPLYVFMRWFMTQCPRYCIHLYH